MIQSFWKGTFFVSCAVPIGGFDNRIDNGNGFVSNFSHSSLRQSWSAAVTASHMSFGLFDHFTFILGGHVEAH